MKRIAILSNNYIGLSCFRQELIEQLTLLGYQVCVYAPYDEKTEDIKSIGCKTYHVAFDRRGKNPFADIYLIYKYIKWLKRMRPDIVLSYTIKPNLYGGIASCICRVPQIANITGLGSAVENDGWLQKLTIFLYKIGLRKTKMVFFQNTANLKFCERHKMVNGAKELLPGSGVNLHYHIYRDYPKETPIKFIFIGRLMKEKGIEEYIGVAKIIKKKYATTEFHILGACEDEYNDIIQELHKDGLIIYHGHQLDVRPFIAMCHCTIHPSFYPEGMSNVLLESCANGRPIITTGRPGCGEIIEDNINGFIIKEQNIIDIVAKVEKFILLPYEQKVKMSIEARRKVLKEFDRKIVVNAYLRAINKILYV